LVNPLWRSQLQDSGAVIADDRVLHFGSAALEIERATDGDVVADLSDVALIEIEGPDAERFLQGQLTCDVRDIDAGHSRLGAYCNPKGRVLACFRLFRRNGGYYLSLPKSLLADSLARLKKYVLLSKVKLTVASNLIQLGYSGPAATSLLKEYLGDMPQAVDDTYTKAGLTIICVSGTHPRYILIGTPEAVAELWSALRTHVAPVGTPVWELLDILAGVPTVLPETTESFIPQWLNLDILGGISFKKGCYTGQEVVARTHYLGKLKRRMYRLHCACNVSPRPGHAVYSSAIRQDEAVGTIVNAQCSAEGGVALLAVLQMESISGLLRLISNDGPACTLQSLPYELHTDTET
jgi:tRNA-modifying protein YgfZ